MTILHEVADGMHQALANWCEAHGLAQESCTIVRVEATVTFTDVHGNAHQVKADVLRMPAPVEPAALVQAVRFGQSDN